MSVTLKQIAEKAGVSRGTVDRALHDRLEVNSKVAKRIKCIASEMGYTPNYAGKLLADRQYKKLFIGVLIHTEDNPFYEDIIRGAREALREYADFGISGEVKVVTHGGAQDLVDVMSEFVSLGAGGLVVTPMLDPLIQEKVNELKNQGIPVINVNKDLRDSDRLAYVGCPERKSGIVMAELLTMLADGRNMKIGVMNDTKSNLATTRRYEGFMDFLERNAPQVRVAEHYLNEGKVEVAYRQTLEAVEEHPDLDYFCVVGAGVSGAIKAAKELPVEVRPKLLVYDLFEEVQNALRDGIVQATVTQQPFEQGYWGVQTMAKYLAFDQTPENDRIHTELSVILSSCLH